MADNPQTEIEVINDTGAPLPVSVIGASTSTPIGNIGDALKVALFLGGASAPKTFVARATSVAIGNGKSMISLVNTSGSTVKIKLRELWITNVQTTGVTGIIANFELNSIVGHSAGTSLTPKAFDSTDTLNGSVTARTGATVTTEGTSYARWLWSSDEWGVGPADVESTDHANQNLIPHYQDSGRWGTITLNANEGLHVKQVTNSTVGTFDLDIVFTQE